GDRTPGGREGDGAEAPRGGRPARVGHPARGRSRGAGGGRSREDGTRTLVGAHLPGEAAAAGDVPLTGPVVRRPAPAPALCGDVTAAGCSTLRSTWNAYCSSGPGAGRGIKSMRPAAASTSVPERRAPASRTRPPPR